jgi:2-polyprenyl-3-methyl-5-hydroxy-6-metoxy-1,4-benzoquinol methylase
MQVLNTKGLRTILDLSDQQWEGSVLDIGAGAGGTTVQMQDIFHEVTAIDASFWNCWRMRKRGIHNVFHALDLKDVVQQDKKYDVVSLMNVLDRC